MFIIVDTSRLKNYESNMLTKAALFAFLFIPLFSAFDVADLEKDPENDDSEVVEDGQPSSPEEAESSTTAASSDTGSDASETTTSTSSGTSYIIWTKALFLAAVLLLK